jgi:hypothetical protein
MSEKEIEKRVVEGLNQLSAIKCKKLADALTSKLSIYEAKHIYSELEDLIDYAENPDEDE